MEDPAEIPAAWEKITVSDLSGIVMVIGAPDVGKSTFARYLFRRLSADFASQQKSQQPDAHSKIRAAYLDGDPGQSQFGPPTTMTLCFHLPSNGDYLPIGEARRYFIGSISPRGHMLPMLVGAARLSQAAFEAGAQCVVYDTSGLIDPSQGGQALKQAKIDLLRPALVVAIQREQELEPILMPLRRSRRVRLITLEPSLAVRRRDSANRQKHRRTQFASYFASSHERVVDWSSTAVFPLPRFSLNRLVAFEDIAGLTLGLGIVIQIDRPSRRVTLLTPLLDLKPVNALRLGDIALNPQGFSESKLGA